MRLKTTTPTQHTLKSNWDLIENSRAVMSKQISSLADSLFGTRRKQLKSISRWLNGTEGYEQALKRPDVLCFCQPWVDTILSKSTPEPLTEFEIEAAIGKGFCKFETRAALPRNLIPFLYPLFSFYALMTTIILGSIWIIPEFKKLFEEFGISLPLITQSVLRLSQWIQAVWMPIVAVLVLVPIVLLILARISQYNSAYSLSWFDRRLRRHRTKLSAWATHVASLLSAGLDETEAVQIAGSCSASSRLRANCVAFAENPKHNLLDPGRYPLIYNSFSLNDRPAKIAILEETARYYRSVSRVVQSWWLAWLSKAIIYLIGAVLFYVVAAMLLPLLSIISGLTGF